jgi:4-cresol dehydrogenase (hydroxylating)
VAEARRLVKQALAGKASKIQFLDDTTLKVANRFAKPLGALTGWDLSGALDLVGPVYGLTKGIPTSHSLKSCYWRHRELPSQMNLDAGDCGLFWCAPVAPAEGKHVETVARIVYDVLLDGGFEPMLTITLLTERSASCVVSMTYDRRVPGEDEKAHSCYVSLLRELARQGYHSYRLGIQGMGQMNGTNGYNRLLHELKKTMDPNNILSPGRYNPSSSQT